MTHAQRIHGGLVFFDNRGHGLDGYCRIVASTLEDYGHMVERQSILSNNEARIATSAYAIRLTMVAASGQNRVPALPDGTALRLADLRGGRNASSSRLELTLVPANPAATDTRHSQLVLLVMLYRMIEAYGARWVEWLDSNTVLPAARFMSAFATVSPRRVRGRQEVLDADDPRFAPLKETPETYEARHDIMSATPPMIASDASPVTEDQALAIALRSETRDSTKHDPAPDVEEDAENDIRRLAAWGMTGVVACISGPVGLSMAAVNLARGEDFRLNTHVLSLTGLIGVLTSGTAMADVLSMLPI